MACVGPKTVDDDDPLTAIYRKLEYFPTPPWGARAGGELVKLLDPEARSIWEPACGEGHMAAPLAESFCVYASDVYPHGYGEVVDFLSDDASCAIGEPDWIFTNPPFSTAAEFVRLGLQRARRGVVILQRLQFLETPARYHLLYGDQPMTLFAPFAERLPMVLGGWDPAASSASGYAYFIWMKGADPRPPMGIPPGTKARLTMPNDARRFAKPQPAGLLDLMAAE